jgi:hypothetical protein
LVLEVLLKAAANPTVRDAQGLLAILVAKIEAIKHLDHIRRVLR